jgi:AraC-like DNA-binding protein
MSQNRQPSLREAPLVAVSLPSPVMGLAEDRDSGNLILPHKHDSAQLIHAAKGVMTVNTEDGLWVVPPQRAVWVPAFTAHSIRMTGRVELRTIYLDPKLRPIEGEACCVVRVSKLLHASIMRVIEFRQPYASDGRESRIVDVILDEIREAPTAPLHLPTPRDPRARRIADAFREHPGDRRSAGEWARWAGASERTVERLFRSEVGMTLGRWQQQARLLRALEILAAGQSVTTVALEVGFETPSAFIAMFKRAMGTTPAKYFRSQPSV